MRLIDELKKIIAAGAATSMSFNQFLEREIAKWKVSHPRQVMIDGERYYNGDQDILRRCRMAIGKDGDMEEVKNLPNNRLIDNQFAKMVNQKVNYLLAKPITYESGNEKYDTLLKNILNASFQRKLKNGGVDAFCGGGSWMYVYIGDDGKLKFQRFAPYEILPFWRDSEHEDLECAVRVYQIEAYEGTKEVIVEKVEVFKADGVERYVLSGGTLIPDVDNPSENYIKVGDNEYNWGRVPLVYFKANAHELPLIKRLKSLQDALNIMLSDLPNAMEENAGGQGVLVIKNYDGTNLGEFRRNLSTYRAVKVKTVDGADGGVESLEVTVNAANYESVLKLLKKAIIENAMGYDAKDDRMGGNANTMNIRSMYSDIDLDANDMEAEYQAAFLPLLELVNTYLKMTGQGDYFNTPVTITFNRDIIVNELEIISSLAQLGVKVSNETLLGQLPFVNNVQKEVDRLQEEQQANIDMYGGAFGGNNNNDDDNNGDDDNNE